MKKYYAIIDESSGRYHNLFSTKLFKTYEEAEYYIKFLKTEEEIVLGYLLHTARLTVVEMGVVK